MAVKNRTLLAEPMDSDELSFWRRSFLQSLPDCLAIKRTPEFCAHVAADTADAAIREYRRRVSPSRRSGI